MRKLTFLLVFLIPVWAMAQKFSAEAGTVTLDFAKKADVITWINPAPDMTEYADKEMILQIGIKLDVEIARSTIYRNGSPQSQSRGFKKAKAEKEFSETIEQKIFLEEGDNLIKIDLEDVNGVKYSDERIIKVEDLTFAAIKNRRKYALMFATNDYDSWGDLVNPVDDAREIGNELATNYGFEVEYVEDATQDEVLSKIREYGSKSYLDHDQLLIFFAGHGQFDEINGEGYIVTKDSKTYTEDENFTTYISHNILRTRVNNIPAPHIFLVMDACFAGTIDPTVAAAGARGGDEYSATAQQLISNKLKYTTRKFLTSGGKDYVSDGIKGSNSPFAAQMLTALRSDPPYGVLTLDLIKTYAEAIPQQPRFGGFGKDQAGSDFVFEKVK